jgi:mRNA-degrading endonuclease RelE of RelBE toxin-antitoxin system
VVACVVSETCRKQAERLQATASSQLKTLKTSSPALHAKALYFVRKLSPARPQLLSESLFQQGQDSSREVQFVG